MLTNGENTHIFHLMFVSNFNLSQCWFILTKKRQNNILIKVIHELITWIDLPKQGCNLLHVIFFKVSCDGLSSRFGTCKQMLHLFFTTSLNWTQNHVFKTIYFCSTHILPPMLDIELAIISFNFPNIIQSFTWNYTSIPTSKSFYNVQ